MKSGENRFWMNPSTESWNACIISRKRVHGHLAPAWLGGRLFRFSHHGPTTSAIQWKIRICNTWTHGIEIPKSNKKVKYIHDIHYVHCIHTLHTCIHAFHALHAYMHTSHTCTHAYIHTIHAYIHYMHWLHAHTYTYIHALHYTTPHYITSHHTTLHTPHALHTLHTLHALHHKNQEISSKNHIHTCLVPKSFLNEHWHWILKCMHDLQEAWSWTPCSCMTSWSAVPLFTSWPPHVKSNEKIAFATWNPWPWNGQKSIHTMASTCEIQWKNRFCNMESMALNCLKSIEKSIWTPVFNVFCWKPRDFDDKGFFLSTFLKPR